MQTNTNLYKTPRLQIDINISRSKIAFNFRSIWYHAVSSFVKSNIASWIGCLTQFDAGKFLYLAQTLDFWLKLFSTTVMLFNLSSSNRKKTEHRNDKYVCLTEDRLAPSFLNKHSSADPLRRRRQTCHCHFHWVALNTPNPCHLTRWGRTVMHCRTPLTNSAME